MKTSLIPFLFFLMSCSTFEAWRAEIGKGDTSEDRRAFQVRNVWAQSTLKETNERYKKINRMTPILAGDLVIQGNGMDGMVAYDRKTGEQRWRIDVPNGVEAGGAVVNDRLFFGGNDGRFYSASLRNGSVLWAFDSKAENLSEPSLDTENGVVFFLTGNNVVYALDAESGKSIWSYSRQDTNNFSVRGGTKPVLKNGLLYVGFSEGSVIAFNSRSGSPVWEVQLNKSKRFRDIDATPVVDGDVLYVAGYDDRLYCLQAQRGEVIWKIDGGSYAGPAVLGDRIYYPTSQGEIWALKKSDGTKLWTYPIKDGVPTGVRIYQGLVVFGESQGDLVFIDAATGQKVGSFEPGLGILSAPAIDEKNKKLYFISGGANVYGIEADWAPPSAFPHLR